jgi:hypothetical protein
VNIVVKAAQLGWCLADAYRIAPKATPESDNRDHPPVALSDSEMPHGLRQRALLLLADSLAHQLQELIGTPQHVSIQVSHSQGEDENGLPWTAERVLALHERMLVWLIVANSREAKDAYQRGRSLSDMVQAPAQGALRT